MTTSSILTQFCLRLRSLPEILTKRKTVAIQDDIRSGKQIHPPGRKLKSPPPPGIPWDSGRKIDFQGFGTRRWILAWILL
jgi:hypothetical protein